MVDEALDVAEVEPIAVGTCHPVVKLLQRSGYLTTLPRSFFARQTLPAALLRAAAFTAALL
jgi:hypothetical protein